MRLELGGGRKPKPGYTNLDIHNGQIKADLEEGIPLPSDSVSNLYSHHCLEHLAEDKIEYVLSECFRVLRSGRNFNVIVPDFAYGYENIKLNETDNRHMDWYGVIFGSPREAGQAHKTAFTEGKLRRQLSSAGFEIKRITYPNWYGRNLNVIARKP